MWSCIVMQDYCSVHKIRTFIPNTTSYLSHQEAPVVLCGHCSAMKNKAENNDTLDMCDDDHQFDWERILMDLLALGDPACHHSTD
ncbi:uncharacterized protein TNIN_378951 [Trichonephila inaurata madagascariensis]|uniref:Uncharacterized protein n=1 Tax=Trichonephila inaurata madagascariensis TaxID=2747483 RepID=A0A8X7BT20_9ARAC|nr:uncharacterized protein TNIN_378951 [Trichonephila inaurata madagascariensis]